jgi:UDP:flavonoid glycosyltransferase YjiC (YdhE family)
VHASVIWAAARVLILTSAAFDWPAAHLPANVRHVGTPEDGAKPVQEGNEWLTDGKGPFIVVSLSTLNQGQTATLKNILAALSGLPIRALVTLGPTLESEQFEAPSNVRLEKFVQHDLVLPHAAALVTQCGIGTLTKALRHGVPMVCLPLVGRGEPLTENRTFRPNARKDAVNAGWREIFRCAPCNALLAG